MTKTPGYEKFEHLTDKSSLLLYMLKREAEALAQLRNEVTLLRNENCELASINRKLTVRVELLVEKKDIIDTRAGDLLGVLDEAHLI